MNKHADNLRRTRADMLGTDDEEHYWECHAAAAEIERLAAIVDAVNYTIAAGFKPPAILTELLAALDGEDNGKGE